MPKGKLAGDATKTMLGIAHEFVDLDSKDPEDVVTKQWVVRQLLSSHLSMQQMKQAFEMLENVTERYGLAPSARFYDRFTKYFAVRGEREWAHCSPPSTAIIATFIHSAPHSQPSSALCLCLPLGRIDRFNDILQRMVNKGAPCRVSSQEHHLPVSCYCYIFSKPHLIPIIESTDSIHSPESPPSSPPSAPSSSPSSADLFLEQVWSQQMR